MYANLDAVNFVNKGLICMKKDTWNSRWKAIAKYYRRELQIERGIRCVLCENKLDWLVLGEVGACKKCEKILIDAKNEPATRTLNPEATEE